MSTSAPSSVRRRLLVGALVVVLSVVAIGIILLLKRRERDDVHVTRSPPAGLADAGAAQSPSAPPREAGLLSGAEQLLDGGSPSETAASDPRADEREPLRKTDRRPNAGRRVDLVISGDPLLRQALLRRVKGARVVAHSDRGLSLSVTQKTTVAGNEATSTCRAAISELPRKNLLGSLASSATTAGEGMTVAELKAEAATACAAALADDVSKWVRKRR